ncbi:MAG: ROK family protein [Phycisphaerales bacterium]|jgi:glucokinase|nr:ROK family protein [Phycisphaerales bacterium]
MIGVDIGGTNLLVGLVEGSEVVERLHTPVSSECNFEVVVKQVCSQVRALAPGTLDRVGIAVAGSVDCKTGIVHRAQNLNWDSVPLGPRIADELGCDVLIENDVTAAAWGEFRFGAGVDVDSMFAVWIGTGIGGGLILDHQIWRGPLGTAGEFGMSISSPEDSAAPFRHLEAVASRSGMQRLLQMPELTTEMLAKGFGTDKTITLAIEESARRVGTGIANVVTLLSLDCVVLGGGLVEALGSRYTDEIHAQCLSDVFPAHCKQCTLQVTKLGPDAGLLGAASLASQS